MVWVADDLPPLSTTAAEYKNLSRSPGHLINSTLKITRRFSGCKMRIGSRSTRSDAAELAPEPLYGAALEVEPQRPAPSRSTETTTQLRPTPFYPYACRSFRDGKTAEPCQSSTKGIHQRPKEPSSTETWKPQNTSYIVEAPAPPRGPTAVYSIAATPAFGPHHCFSNPDTAVCIDMRESFVHVDPVIVTRSLLGLL